MEDRTATDLREAAIGCAVSALFIPSDACADPCACSCAETAGIRKRPRLERLVVVADDGHVRGGAVASGPCSSGNNTDAEQNDSADLHVESGSPGFNGGPGEPGDQNQESDE